MNVCTGVWFSRKLYRLCKVRQLIKFLTFRSVHLHPSQCARPSFSIFRGSGSETGGGGWNWMHAPIHGRRCCEILLRPFAEQTKFITVGTKTYSPRGVRTFDHALYNLPSVGVFPYKFGRRLIYAIFATW